MTVGDDSQYESVYAPFRPEGIGDLTVCASIYQNPSLIGCSDEDAISLAYIDYLNPD